MKYTITTARPRVVIHTVTIEANNEREAVDAAFARVKHLRLEDGKLLDEEPTGAEGNYVWKIAQ
jgi:hypothetical protein